MKPSSPITFDVFYEEAHRYLVNQEDQNSSTVHPRSLVLKLGVLVGELCSSVLQYAPMDNSTETELDSKEIRSAMGRLLFGLCVASTACEVELRTAILNKMELNKKKYPVELCKGKSGKYTLYSNETGITKTQGQRTTTPTSSPTKSKQVSIGVSTIEGITEVISDFATERNWYKYHTPRSLVLALMGELGELAELFQWKGDEFVMEDLEEDEQDHVGQEFADVTIYLLRLAHICNIDIGKEALYQAKMMD